MASTSTRLFLCATLLLFGTAGCVSEARQPTTATFQATSSGIEGPSTLDPGVTALALNNQGEDVHHL